MPGGRSWNGARAGKSQPLQFIAGVLLFCDQGKEDKAKKEATQLLTAAIRGGDEEALESQQAWLDEYGFGNAGNSDSDNSDSDSDSSDSDGDKKNDDVTMGDSQKEPEKYVDIADLLDAEIAAMRAPAAKKKENEQKNPPGVKAYELGCRGLAFIGFTSQAPEQIEEAQRRAKRLLELKDADTEIELAPEAASVLELPKNAVAPRPAPTPDAKTLSPAELAATAHHSPRVNPNWFVNCIFDRMISSGHMPLTSVLRMVPVQTCCVVNMSTVVECARPLLGAALREACARNPRGTCTWSIQFRARNNDKLKSHDVNREFGKMVMAECVGARVDYNQPDIVVFVEVCKVTCCISVCKSSDVEKYLNFNFRRILSTDLNAEKKEGEGDKPGKRGASNDDLNEKAEKVHKTS